MFLQNIYFSILLTSISRSFSFRNLLRLESASNSRSKCFFLASKSSENCNPDRNRIGRILGVAVSTFCFTTSPSEAALTASDISRFEAGLSELRRLDTDWTTIVKGGGDNIRRYLGTVYTPPTCSSPLCSYPIFIDKFVRAHYDDFDVESFEEPKSMLLEALNQADFLAYSSIFSDYGNGGVGKDYIASSHVQVKRAITAMEEVLTVLKKDI